MISKTKISARTARKMNSELVESVVSARKQDGWREVAFYLSGPTRRHASINLSEIEDSSKDGEVVVIPGKVLGNGKISKKVKVVAMSFSERAKDKLSKSKIEFSDINTEISKNPSAKNVRILR